MLIRTSGCRFFCRACLGGERKGGLCVTVGIIQLLTSLPSSRYVTQEENPGSLVLSHSLGSAVSN